MFLAAMEKLTHKLTVKTDLEYDILYNNSSMIRKTELDGIYNASSPVGILHFNGQCAKL